MIKFALVGCGRVAPRHAQSITNLPGSQLLAVADIVQSRAEQFSRKYSSDCYLDYRHILDRQDIDVVSICTPSGIHAKIALDALDAGKHVLVEKPIALSLEDADKMIEKASKQGKKLCVVLQNRLNPPIQEARTLVDNGKLGKLMLGNATVRWYRPQQYYEDGWHGTWAMDGGALMNQSIHHIDALQWFLGDVKSVFAYTATQAHSMEAEDTGVAVVKFKNGAIGSVEGSTITYPQNIEGSLALFGEHGSIKIGGTALNRKIFWKVDGQLELEAEMLTRDLVDPPSVYGFSHQLVIQDLIESIETEKKPYTGGEEARKSLALVLAIYESAQTEMPVEL